uniref:Ig-like domain-containing protein n=1 Tax=Scleropages formosus TaxID=113540 RepID=A0A8C9SIY8_SCLFO
MYGRVAHSSSCKLPLSFSFPLPAFLHNMSGSLAENIPQAMLTVTPPGGQHFRGEHFSLQCEVAGRNSTGWTLKHLVKGKVESGCVTLGGRISMMKQGECVFSRLYSGNGGPYWCESTDGHQRSRIVNITVGYGYMIIQGPTHPVSAGENFKLRCIYWHDPSNATTFYKDGVEIVAQKSTELMIQNATKANEGFYKCIDSVNKQESSETWVCALIPADSIKVQLTLEPPDSRVFAGEPVSLRCVVDGASSLGWIYNWSQQINPRHQTAGDRYTITTMTAADQGPYWCTVRKNGTDENLWHNGSMFIHGPAHPVSEGENFKLHCVYRWRPSNTTSFYKDGVMMATQNSTEMTIWNATKANEGFYKCVNYLTQEESSETWVSVTGETLTTKWVTVKVFRLVLRLADINVKLHFGLKFQKF